MIRRLLSYLDERSGLSGLWAGARDCPLPGGASWARTFGMATLAFLLLEFLTGVGLSAWYAPTVQDAWASVHFIQFKLSLGWLLRGLHHVGGTALIVLAIVHLVQALIYGAYQAPRELTWVSGVVFLLLLVVVSHTGYLLPQDLRAYWATQVLVGIAGNQPVIGPTGQALIQGGPLVGNATLTHFYALHVGLMPVALFGMLGAHLWLRSRHAAATPKHLSPETAAERAQTYAPFQLFRDVAMSAAAMGVVAALVWRDGGVELGGPADPAVEFIARPEWYMMPIFELRHWFTGSSEFVATVILPGVGTTLLAGLPWLHGVLARRTARAHSLLVVGTLGGLASAVALGAVIPLADASDPAVLKTNAAADALAAEAHRLAMAGVPLEGPLFLYKNDPLVWGARVWDKQCKACHTECKEDPFKGSPCLEGYASRTWLTKFMKDPSAKHFFGNTKIDSMDAYTGSDEKLAAMVEFLVGESGATVSAPLVESGKAAFDDEGCGSCHTLDGVGGDDAPDLKGWASPAWLAAFIRTPGAKRFYGDANEMDDFPHEKLSKEELEAVITYLRAQTDAQAKYP
ncbi:MAG: cytochrome b N-terminal domain-containing protein [Myxococcaceae bacterium]|nr:cytochrome b N-terminal domain-containing protein [Myxococcaceae bacterium]